MTRVIFQHPEHPLMVLSVFKQSMEEVLNLKNIKGITLRNILQELLPEFSTSLIRVNIKGDIVLDETLYNAIEFGTLTIPQFHIISRAKRRMGGRPAWQIRS